MGYLYLGQQLHLLGGIVICKAGGAHHAGAALQHGGRGRLRRAFFGIDGQPAGDQLGSGQARCVAQQSDFTRKHADAGFRVVQAIGADDFQMQHATLILAQVWRQQVDGGVIGQLPGALACQMLLDAATAFKHRGRKPFQHIIRRGGVLVVPDAGAEPVGQRLQPEAQAAQQRQQHQREQLDVTTRRHARYRASAASSLPCACRISSQTSRTAPRPPLLPVT